MSLADLAYWVNEREAIRLRKQWYERPGSLDREVLYHLAKWDEQTGSYPSGEEIEKGILTRDPILSQYRFCNVSREHDRVTVWIRENIREPYAQHEHLWLMLAIARTVNWPPTIQTLVEMSGSWPSHSSFDPKKLGETLDALTGNKIYTGAYMIRAESNPNAPWYSWTKQRYIAEIVIGRLWEDREDWLSYLTTDDPQNQLLRSQDVWENFQSPHYIGWGPFMAGQVVADMRHTRYLANASDRETWAAIGPGSRRGLNRLAGRDVDCALSQERGLEELRALVDGQDEWRAPHVARIDIQDFQSVLCEVDKMLRVKNGEGRPRAKYVQGRGY